MGKARRRKPPRSTGSSDSCQKFAPGSENHRKPPTGAACRQPYQRRKPCPPTEKCIPPAPPCCRKRPLNPKCPQPQSPCPPPCPTPCPKAPEKPPPPKICYRKCPPLPKLPKLPKYPKIPPPPPPAPLPKLPRRAKCPIPCPPPLAPPLPKCPRPPRCPECPPQRECPPPPPCEPCPCPPPCPPPCCPPPPPCPPCPPPIPCPKPLPCPPPSPKVCPPCPPCSELPPCPPCPPPPPCCPCPCPEPPPPCPCPKPCPPCKPPEVSCPEDVPSCPKCQRGSTKKRKMSTYHAPSMFDPRTIRSRKLHVCSWLLGRSSKSGKKPPSCKGVSDICETGRADVNCAKGCDRKSACEEKRPKCVKAKKETKKKIKKKDLCPDSCIPEGKCNRPAIPKPAKMTYGPVKCPTPKLAQPKPCPKLAQAKTSVCEGARTKKKEVCVPPPLPEPPTNPVILCPCPPPPKLHPGPCPCYGLQDVSSEKSSMPPCPFKEKYPCPDDSFYCPPVKTECKTGEGSSPAKEKKKRKK